MSFWIEGRGLENQNLKRSMNCSCRGKPVPVFGDAALSLLLLKFTVELMTPKVESADKLLAVSPGVYTRVKLPGSPS